jgi:hypothetical protein
MSLRQGLQAFYASPDRATACSVSDSWFCTGFLLSWKCDRQGGYLLRSLRTVGA